MDSPVYSPECRSQRRCTRSASRHSLSWGPHAALWARKIRVSFKRCPRRSTNVDCKVAAEIEAWSAARLVSSQRLIKECQHGGMAFRVVRVDQ